MANRDAGGEGANASRPFDAGRYFRGDHRLRFYHVGTPAMRRLARAIYSANRAEWTIDDAMAFADTLIIDPYLEAKSVGIEVVARFRRSFTPRLLGRWKRWLADNHSANWATTDAMAGELIGPLLVDYPDRAVTMRAWSRAANLWVRRASIVSLIPLLRRRLALDLAYEIARTLHPDREDLIQKAVGWTLREAGKADAPRLERYLRVSGGSVPRTTVRYAIERFPEATRRRLLKATRIPMSEDKSPDRSKDRKRLQKIGAKPDWRTAVLAVGEPAFIDELRTAVAEVTIGRVPDNRDAIFFGVIDAKELVRLPILKQSLKQNGALWIIRPKGRPEISERAVMAAGQAAGLVDVKVISFSPTHTAEKFVIPVANRR